MLLTSKNKVCNPGIVLPLLRTRREVKEVEWRFSLAGAVHGWMSSSFTGVRAHFVISVQLMLCVTSCTTLIPVEYYELA